MAKTRQMNGKEEWSAAEEERLTGVIRELSARVPVQVATYVKQAAPYLAKAMVLVMLAMPHILAAFGQMQTFVESLPEDVIYAGLGFAVCFFGGVFPATIAAVEAWRIAGGSEAVDCLKVLVKEWKKVDVANKKDEVEDLDNDGVADVKTLAPQELITRKAKLVMAAVDPEKVSGAVTSLWKGWVGVLVVLKVQFAMTVTFGERIGQHIYQTLSKSPIEQTIAEQVPEEYKKWVPVALRWCSKMIAMSLAWWVTRYISAFHSAIRGGLLCGYCLVRILKERKVVDVDPEQVYWDEAIGYTLAVAGLLFQLSFGFYVPFPLSLLLWPVQFLEAFVRWSVAA